MTMPSHDYAAICDTLRERLRLRADPLGIKLFESIDAMAAVPGVRRPQKGVRFTMCQAVGQARWLGWTLGVAHENVAATVHQCTPNSSRRGIVPA